MVKVTFGNAAGPGSNTYQPQCAEYDDRLYCNAYEVALFLRMSSKLCEHSRRWQPQQQSIRVVVLNAQDVDCLMRLPTDYTYKTIGRMS